MNLAAATFAFVRELSDFSYGLSFVDRVWNILFPDKEGKWHHLHINKYKHTFYITHVTGDGGSLEVEPKKDVRALSSMGTSSYSLEDASQLTAVWEPLIESARKRLLAQDNIGIIPSYAMLHRANQHFNRDEDVFDVMYYDDLGRFKRRITPFFTWEQLPILKPINASMGTNPPQTP